MRIWKQRAIYLVNLLIEYVIDLLVDDSLSYWIVTRRPDKQSTNQWFNQSVNHETPWKTRTNLYGFVEALEELPTAALQAGLQDSRGPALRPVDVKLPQAQPLVSPKFPRVPLRGG